jgi:hypothetical protein
MFCRLLLPLPLASISCSHFSAFGLLLPILCCCCLLPSAVVPLWLKKKTF